MTWVSGTTPPRNSRRRAFVFFGTVVLALAVSLLFVYARPAEYRGAAKIQISPARDVTQPAERLNSPIVATNPESFLTQVQVLTSRPMLARVLARLYEGGLSPDLGSDPIAAIQQMLHVEPVLGTQVVEILAESRDQGLVAPLVNAVVTAYRQYVAELYSDSSSKAHQELKDEISTFDQQVTAKRQTVETFRTQHDIVSIEHKENDVIAQIDGLSKAYTDAKDRRSKAQARLQALQKSAASGNTVVRAKDDPTLAAMEQRASLLREQWQELQRRFTPSYLSIDPNAVALQARLGNLENQLKTERAASAQAALTEAQEDVAAAQNAEAKLQRDVAENQKQAQEFATHLNEYKALRQDLDRVEELHRAALGRLVKLEASERERAPQVELLEAAVPNSIPFWPDYRRDALIAVGGSLILALFAVWLMDFIAGPRVSPAIPPMLLQHSLFPTLLGRGTDSAPLSLAAPAVRQIAAPAEPPRPLDDAEIAALIDTANEDAQLVVLGLFSGLTSEEIVALHWDQIAFADDAIHVERERLVPLNEPLRSMLKARHRRQPEASGTVLSTSHGAQWTSKGIEELLFYTAHDAGLDRPQEITPDAVRYTWLSFLLRQGLRAVDVSAIAGHVPHSDLIALMEIYSPKLKQPLERIDLILPALRELAQKRSD